ncbi:fumarylacetoacetate hydrolase family protein [Neiella sp. HB171785]|uniref:Fumarylacetoacetate hydrolase family protein n=1 Tax=Neiella litorisoli TaxID=2771431 RepID=A0A8J6QJ11_9GAMM|nr:fumarylacetoacetate hydrolase family protein [Neiella litorisoli]MBD1391160.1 fumarylacetoacetate hydrolase family protein [Neiella litorisoli]
MRQVQVDDQWFTPSKIVCVGRNYVEHIEELGNEIPEQMVVFNKPNSALSDTLLASHGEPLHYEAELCLLVKDGRYFAAGVGLDLTKRMLQSQLKAKGLPWERAKAFDGAVVLSPFRVIDQELASLRFELWVDGALRQHGQQQLMMYPPAAILAELNQFTTLLDGDVVMTGTPKGVGQIQPGQTFVVKLFANDALLLSQSWQAL